MAELKTQKNDQSVDAFLQTVADERKRQDCYDLLALMQEVTGAEPVMWGSSIIGFGSYHYKYASGREGEWFLTGFAPRKQNLTLYIMAGFDQYGELMSKLGKHSTGKSCLYIKRLADVDQDVLRRLVALSAEHVARTNA
ncbi:MAG: DUF1801 domain-containing protein [Anaerolineales bacterium]|nr:DUF1801 domain-containing protein [Anaerolineales bacterium]MCB8953805.1 DUF1801 domain-containing protein [Ardenticatenales bacterium]